MERFIAQLHSITATAAPRRSATSANAARTCAVAPTLSTTTPTPARELALSQTHEHVVGRPTRVLLAADSPPKESGLHDNSGQLGKARPLRERLGDGRLAAAGEAAENDQRRGHRNQRRRVAVVVILGGATLRPGRS
jgi:hypothetical protein